MRDETDTEYQERLLEAVRTRLAEWADVMSKDGVDVLDVRVNSDKSALEVRFTLTRHGHAERLLQTFDLGCSGIFSLGTPGRESQRMDPEAAASVVLSNVMEADGVIDD
jgi:hypothetical protein